MSDRWNLRLEDEGKAFYERIANALERDIRQGVLQNGYRLPPQRILAVQTGLSVGTITKAYREVEKRGLARAYVGRGTYVLAPGGRATLASANEPPLVDLSLCVIPHQAAGRRYADHRGKFTRHVDLFEALAYAPPVGTDTARRASSRWLKQMANFEIPWERLILTTGCQHALALAFGALCRRGDTILCEAETSPGMRSLAVHRGYKLTGLKMDGEGVLPNYLDRAILQTKANVIFVTPTVQNPTGRTMGIERRAAISKIARLHKVWVVEDDSFSLFSPRDREQIVPLAAQLPDQSFYISGVAKSIAPGLRLGFLACPSRASIDEVIGAVRATIYTSSALGGQLFCQWVEDGTAFQIAEAVREEVEQRNGIAHEILGPLHTSKISHTLNLWFQMPLLVAEQAAERAFRAGVAVATHTNPLPSGAVITGIRVCLGAPINTSVLTTGLERLKSALAPEIQRLPIAMP